MTLNDIKQELAERGFNDSFVFESPDYSSAFIGVSHNGRAVYSFDKMVEYLGNDKDALDNLRYNVLPSLETLGDNSPIVVISQK